MACFDDAGRAAGADAVVQSVRQRTLTMSQAPIWELPDRDRQVEGLDDNGEPDPAYAAALGLVSAPLGRRAAAAARAAMAEAAVPSSSY